MCIRDRRRVHGEEQQTINTNKDMSGENTNRLSDSLLPYDQLDTFKNTKFLSVDQAMELAGTHHRYQWRLLLIFSLQFFVASFTIMAQPFLMYPITWKCPTPGNPHKICSDSEYKGPYEPKYFSDQTHLDSFTVRYELYGPRRDLKDLQASVYFFTGCIGSLFFSFLADSFGRRISTLLGYVIMAISLAFGAVFLNFPSYFLALSAVGFAVAGYTNITFVLISEPSSDDFRKFISSFILVVWAVGEGFCVLAAYYITDAHWFLLLCMAIPMLMTSVLFYWVYESPKFLLTKKKFEDLLELMDKISIINKKELPDYQLSEELEEYQRKMSEHPIIHRDSSPSRHDARASMKKSNARRSMLQQQPDEINYTYFDLFRFKSVRKITIGLSLYFFVMYYCYYGAYSALSSIGGSLYLNSALAAGAEGLAYLLMGPLCKFRRKVVFSGCFFLNGLVGLAFFLVSIPDACRSDASNYCTEKIIQIALSFSSRLLVCIPFGVIYIYTNELFPTVIRSLGIGVSSFIGRFGDSSLNRQILKNDIGGSAAPVVVGFCYNVIHVHPMATFGLISFLACFCGSLLKETLGKKLEDEIQEVRKEGSSTINTQITYPRCVKVLCLPL
eukprot:TRINITY_DN1458_c0_g1_i11.p1 TRINITY_DN1458_c0_g1~~TRINITY_DN1458_c0_g1_i11.p1  ORF type:complete len:614 (-),score=58.13 TRINITY_DN1458_c0_g1_i11:63-1904(-)